MTKEEFMKIFLNNAKEIYDIDMEIKQLDDVKLIILHMMAEKNLKERGLINDEKR